MQSLFLVFLLLLTPLLSNGCGHPLSAADLYHGQVVDEETGQPLVGAAVTVIWYKAPVVHLASPRYFQSAQETVTDSQGKFELLVSPGFDWNPFTFIIDEPTIIIYQPGYEPVHATSLLRMGFKSYTEFAAALEKGFVVKLLKLKTDKELRYYSGADVHPDVPYEQIPKLIQIINVHRKNLGLPPIGLVK